MTPRAWTPLIVGAAASAVTLLTLWRDPPLKLLWNASASAPLGLYWIVPASEIARGDLLVIRPPQPLAILLAERGYLPLGVPLLKPAAALSGQRVCRTGGAILIDGKALAHALARDRHGRDLPVWRGCRTIAPGEVFLLNPARPDSLDGRYFGPVAATTIVGRARPLWRASRRDDRRISGSRPR